MNDTDTNPQRHGASSSDQPSHRSADESREPLPARDESDTTAQPGSEATAEQPPGAPAHHHTAPPAGPGAAQGAAPAAPDAYGAWQRSAGAPAHGWQAPYGAQHQPGYQQSAQYQQPAQYPYPAQPGQAQPGQAQPGQAHRPPLPPWAAPVGGAQPGGPGRGRMVLAAGAAAVVLALGAGGFGAWAALALQDDNGGAVTSSNSAVTRVVDRSSLSQIAEQVQPSVVSIKTGRGEGSGVVLTADGYILSNNHVVASAQGETVQVAFSDGRTATAQIIGTDPRTDLAVVKADNVSGLKFATFGSSASMKIGDSVLALGSPLGLEGSVTRGIISAKDRTIQSSAEGQPNDPFGQQQQPSSTSIAGLLQTDAAINPGNSGGALVNTNGEVIGINTAIATSGQSNGNIGLGFAIPSDKAKTVADALMKGQKVSHPYLGVSLSESSAAVGAVVGSVTPNGPAAKAGLRQGDVITKIGDKTVRDSDDVISAVQAGAVGQQISISYTRNGQQGRVAATLAEAP